MPSTLSYAASYLARPKINRRGSKNGRAKLTEEIVREIRQTFVPIMVGGAWKKPSVTEFARKYGVSPSTISKIVNGKWSWLHCN